MFEAIQIAEANRSLIKTLMEIFLFVSSFMS